MSEDNCTTHHHACDCREAKFAETARENDLLREDLNDAQNTIRGMELKEERIERENATLRALLKRWEKLAAIGLVDVIPDWAVPVVEKLAHDTTAVIEAAQKETKINT